VLVLVIIAALAGYSLGAAPVRAQTEAFPLEVGETVVFSFQDGGTRQCRIER
jgi:hypothetical protein